MITPAKDYKIIPVKRTGAPLPQKLTPIGNLKGT
jgi:hypothetical protein